MIVLLLVLPFTTTGEPLFELGPIVPSGEGLKLAAVIALKINTITLLNLALIGTLSPLQVGNALRLLRVPGNLVQLLLMSVRYISVLENEYARIRRAMKARAFVARSNVHTWRKSPCSPNRVATPHKGTKTAPGGAGTQRVLGT